MANRSFRRGISQSQRRKKSWVQMKLTISTGAQNPGFATSIALETAAPPSAGTAERDGLVAVSGDGSGTDPFVSTLPEECTILRIRGSLLFPENTIQRVPAAGDASHNFGFGVTAITDLDPSSYPGPCSKPDWDGWMFLRQSALKPIDAAATVLDVKAMRKIKTGDAFFVMAESVLQVGPGVVQSWIFDLRLLLLLP